jgi:L-2-hydroxyglutarate oxidase
LQVVSRGAEFDVVVIGGGIVGTATAMALSGRPGTSIALLEAENELAAHQTGHNSGVIHSGLYYRPGSLKARNCIEGREALYRFCEEHDVAHERCGKIVVATGSHELPALEELERRGRANGLTGLERIGPEQIREREPHATGVAGLVVPQTGIVDFGAVTRKYAEIVEQRGGEIHLGTRLERVVADADRLMLKTSAGTVGSANLINCAGLQSDRIARVCGVDPGVRIVPFRGEYYEIVPDRQELVRNLIYPVPDPRFPFLGVHFTRTIHGGIEAGPNAVLALRREGYGRFSISLRDVFSFLFYGGFWKLAARYWRTGLGEIWRSLSKGAFVEALKRLMPELTKRDVRRGGAGVRAQALEPTGRLVDDFRIVEAPRMIHVLNAPSPAATASISIGETIAKMAEQSFGLRGEGD